MTATMYYDNDADPAALAGQTVAIIGYGSQGHAHALNLHESGVDVVVGLAPGSKSRAHAEEAGLRVADVADAVQAADVVMILVPDTAQKAVYDAEIAPNLRAGPAPDVRPRLQPAVRPDRPAGRPWTSGWSRPKGPGHLVRSVYQAGGGVPALFAVERDAVGHRPAPGRWPTPARSATRAPASSRRPSRKRPRPTSSASSPSCAAARRRS